MDFGKVDQAELGGIDFTLPDNAIITEQILAASDSSKPIRFHFGCAKWGRKEWIGQIYPPGSKEKDFLSLYAKNFNSIEFNALFYKMPEIHSILKWKSQVNENFLFCPKFPNIITHISRLNNVEKPTEIFLQAISHFGNNLGPHLHYAPSSDGCKAFSGH